MSAHPVGQRMPGAGRISVLVFGGGAIGMMLELAGARVLAPHFGNSLFVWTSLIGVMLGFMSLGYYLGGRLADHRLDPGNLFWILSSAGASIAAVSILERFIVPVLARGASVRLFAVIAAAVLFAVPSTLLGMVSPYCIRLRMHSVEDSGSTVGTLYAISTVGSIVGTFSAGFWLLAIFGTHDLLVVLAGGLGLLAALVIGSLKRRPRAAMILGLLLLVGLGIAGDANAEGSFDTAYDRYFVRPMPDPVSGRQLLLLTRDEKGAESASYADTGEPYRIQYYEYYDLAAALADPVERALMIGGGTFSYPRLFVAARPSARIDAVEIDPALYEVAKARFGFEDDPRIRIFLEDGRTYLNRSHEPYDIVMIDAFKSEQTVPWQLTTVESMQRCYDALDSDGVLVMNVIGAPDDERREFFGSLFQTIAAVFPQARAFAVQDQSVEGVRNTMIVAFKDPGADVDAMLAAKAPAFRGRMWPPSSLGLAGRPFTDDFAPVDQYLLGF